MKAHDHSGHSSAASAAAPRPLVEVESLAFTYKGANQPALYGVTFSQQEGEMIGIMGASGAGKSTLVKCLNYIVPGFDDGDFQGSVRIARRRLVGGRVCDYAPLVGMVFQDFESQLFSTNVEHEVAFAMEQAGFGRDEMRRRLGPALKAVGLSGFEHRDPTSLSGGEKQRLAIAAVLALRPRLIVLDEPATDLDPQGKSDVFALIRRLRDEGLSLIVIEHESEEIREADRLIILDAGRIAAAGEPGELMARTELLEQCGVHPPELDRLLRRLGIDAHARNVDEAEAILRDRLHLAGDAPMMRHAGLEAGGELAEAEAPDRGSHTLVKIDSVTFSYPHGANALNGIEMTIAAGEFTAIVGQNGSGKTTLAKQMAGLLHPSSGRVILAGRDCAEMRADEIAGLIGYVFQNPDHQLFAATVEEEVAFGPRNFGLAPEEIKRRCDEVLSAVGLEKMRRHDPFLLSKGERQRLAVASVLALRPKLLILDEPTTGLDYREQRRMMDLVTTLNRQGTAIVIITHTPWLVSHYARRVVMMSRGGKLFDGGVRQFFSETGLLQQSAFRPPEITQLGHRFGITALTTEELALALEKRL